MDSKEQMYYADIIAAMAERTIKRLWIALIVAMIVIAGMLAGLLAYISQYDYISSSTEYTQDGRGLNIIGNSNGVDYGTIFENDDESQG